MPFKLFVHPSIKTPADLKGKRLAVKILIDDIKIPAQYAEAGYKEFMKSFAFDGRIPVKGFDLLMESEGPRVQGKFKVLDFIDESFHKQFAKN